MSTVLATVVGLLFGATCAALALPLPAPTHIDGVVAIVGVFVGYTAVRAMQ